MDIKVGDEVRVTEPGHRRHGNGSPEGGWVGHVTKTGRKYATAEYVVTWDDYRGERQSGTKVIEFSMETGSERHSVSSFKASVSTIEQAELKIRQNKARDTLFKAGISVSGTWDRLALEQWEALAELAATFPEYDRSRL